MGNLGPQPSHAIRRRQDRQLRSNRRDELLDRAFFALTIDGGSRSPLRTSRMAARLRSSAASDTALGRSARDDRVEFDRNCVVEGVGSRQSSQTR